ncbi:hypothetical protein LTR97_011649 [Elasticomyces elasticus]|uniref:Urease accessory protein UreF n=1 Tax=Elasticomyces elasticus TaxID=574655 RepID=A0AAN7ZL41_9PEZI|nr:hypothetical protein LTR97_011649 [Elasticomyces elasticus]
MQCESRKTNLKGTRNCDDSNALSEQPHFVNLHKLNNAMNTSPSASLHALLLLSDSALPLGSFAFSSGLESFLAHNKQHHASSVSAKVQAFEAFLEHSLANVASTALPYVLTAYHHSEQLEDLDNDFDASTPCTVARRASITQGRALLTIWERAFSASVSSSADSQEAGEALTAFATASKTCKPDLYGLQLNSHFPPLFGLTCRALSLAESETAYLFLLNHAKALLSAAVRASVIGPYQSQSVLASEKLQRCIATCIKRETARTAEEAAVTSPVMDLWMGRHELLYSRIFNS